MTRLSALALMLVAGLLAGCSKQVASPLASGAGATPNSDKALITSAMAAAPQAIEDGLSDSDFQTTLGGGPAGLMTAIQPLNFWRTIQQRNRTLEFEFSDPDPSGNPTTAIVTIRKVLIGQFNILVGPLPGDPPPPTTVARDVIHKPLEDHWVRRVLLKRVQPAQDPLHPMWRIAGISGVEVTSKDSTTNILSVHIQDAPLDTTIDDPLAFQRLRRVLRFQPGTEVTITVKTKRNDDVVVFYHRDHRFRFHNNGDNTYTAMWPIDLPTIGMPSPGLMHFGVNAFSNGTLFDDQAPYDSRAWLFPFSLVPENLMAEFLP
jgi:hypothetical protein